MKLSVNGHASLGQRIRSAWQSFRHPILARYEGAVQQPYRSWIRTPVQPARLDINKASRTNLLRKARYFERNSDLVNKLADLYEQYVVGPGLQFFPATSDLAWNEAALTYWQDWKLSADITSRQSFDVLQGIVARATVIDGESFILLLDDDEGPRLQVIESPMCATPPQLVKEEGKRIVDGVEVDPRGKPVAYWFSEDGPVVQDGVFQAPPQPSSWQRVEAEAVVHVFEPSRAGQYRGLTLLHPCINTLHDLDDLQLLEMKAARDAAEISNVLEAAAGSSSTAAAIATDGVSLTCPDAAGRQSYIEAAIGGRTAIIQPGEKIQQFRSERPSVATKDYWTSLESKVCAGLGISRQLVYPESLQGTVERAVLSVQSSWFRIRSHALCDRLRLVYEFVIRSGIEKGELAGAPADWRRFNWRPPKSVVVDVGRDSAAMLNELAAGIRTYEDILAEMGIDSKEQLRRRADEVVFIKSLAAERGIDPDEIAARTLPEPSTMEEEPEEEVLVR